MNRHIALFAVIVMTAGAAPRGPDVISGPYVHENLAVFLIHGKDQMTGKVPMTLQDALQQKKVKVHETRDVNNLSIENVSLEEVYVQAGDIVKGGQQDRTLAYDLIVPPKSGRIPIDAFCVEQGRWTGRGAESVIAFEASSAQLNSKDLKLAAKRSRSQEEVWSKVAETQGKLARNTRGRGWNSGGGNGSFNAAVLASASPTSLQLTLENKEVKKTAGEYTKPLLSIIEGKPDVIGYAFAINGQINSADIYGSHALFVKLWPKLLEASATESIAELDRTKTAAPVTIETVRAALAEAEEGTASSRNVTRRVRLITHESDKHVFFETRDRDRGEAWIHRNYLKK